MFLFLINPTPQQPKNMTKNLENTRSKKHNCILKYSLCLELSFFEWSCLNGLLVTGVVFHYWHVIGQHWALVYVHDKLQACDLLQENLDKNID